MRLVITIERLPCLIFHAEKQNIYEKLQKLMTYDINSSYLILFQTIAESANDIETT